MIEALPAGWADQALHAPLLPWLTDGVPEIDELNRQAHRLSIRSGGGQPLVFAAPEAGSEGYEARLFQHGIVETRPDCWHDLFGALVWLTFPRAKAALNRRHFATLAQDQAARQRGPVRDALTQFDECGLIVLCADDSLWLGIRAHRWQEVFVGRRAEVKSKLGFLLFGHGSYDALRSPFAGLCAKAWPLKVSADLLATPLAQQIAFADTALADHFENTADLLSRHWQPIPLLGIPGVTPASEDPAYYADTRQFRPLRAAAAA